MRALDQVDARWRKSSYSSHVANCVEVASSSSAVAVRDTKDREGTVLEFSGARWADFLCALQWPVSLKTRAVTAFSVGQVCSMLPRQLSGS